jgi:hypothetical protein
MRYLLLVLCLLGCGPAAADEPKPLTEAEFANLQADLKTSKETYTQAVQRFESTVAGLSEAVGNQTAELEAVKNKLDVLDRRVSDLSDGVDGLRKLLTADGEPAASVPKVAEAAKAQLPDSDSSPPVQDAPAKANDQKILFHGKAINVGEWLATPLTEEQRVGVGKKDSGSRADVEKHLRWHGLEGDFSAYSRDQLITLHSVAHLKDDLKPAKTLVPSSPPNHVTKKTTVYAIPQPSGGCRNGRCQQPMTYYYSTRSWK